MAIQIHQKRYDRQLIGADRWKKAKQLGVSHTDGWGTFWWCTGVGKTFAACTIASKMLLKNNAYQFIVVVPGEELEKQWNNEIAQFIAKEYIQNFRVFTVHILMNLRKEGKIIQCDLLIADELHEYYTEDRLTMFDGSFISTRWCLGLTGTYEDRDKRHNLIKDILPVIDRIDEEEGVREGYISKFIEYNVAVPLNEREQEAYAQLTDIISKNGSKFGHGGIKLASMILKEDSVKFQYAATKGWYAGMDITNKANYEIFNTWNPSKIIGYAKNFMDAVRQRKNLLYCCSNKITVAKDVVVKFDTLKTICFSQSTAFADALANLINKHYTPNESSSLSKVCVVYHSQIDTIVTTDAFGKQKKKGKTVLKREAIDAIRTGKSRVISTASSLDRGFDVKDIRLGITTSGTQNPTQYSQRKGRALRVESYEEDIIVLIVNLYIRGTTDEVWLRKRQSTSKNVVYWVDSINDINYSPKRNDAINNFLEL